MLRDLLYMPTLVLFDFERRFWCWYRVIQAPSSTANYSSTSLPPKSWLLKSIMAGVLQGGGFEALISAKSQDCNFWLPRTVGMRVQGMVTYDDPDRHLL